MLNISQVKWPRLLRKMRVPGLLIRMKPFIGNSLFYKMEFYLRHGYWPKLNPPRSFNERILYRKLISPHPLSAMVVDKWSVRQYIAEKVGNEVLNQVLWVGSQAEEIPFDHLPQKFVIKVTHGSGWNIIVHDKDQLDRKKTINQCQEWLNSKFSSHLGETHYDLIVAKIIVEAFIDDATYGVPLDYKFYCFRGVVKFICAHKDRFTAHKQNYYDTEWNETPFKVGNAQRTPFERPKLLPEMIAIAEKISHEFDFCRVDLYCPNGEKVIFGEITLTPAAGLKSFQPKEWDFEFGKYWEIDSGQK